MTAPSDSVAEQPRRDPDIERLLHGRLHDPHRVLGLHAAGAHEVVVRVLLPNARRVQLVTPAVELARVAGTALFEWRGPRRGVAAPYRVRWEVQNGEWREGSKSRSWCKPVGLAPSGMVRFFRGLRNPVCLFGQTPPQGV